MDAGAQPRRVAVLCVLLMAGCAAVERSPRGDVPPATAAPVATEMESVAVVVVVPEAPVKASEKTPAPPTRVNTEPKDQARSVAPAPKAPAATSPSPAPAPALAKQEGPPPLDLKSLETRLRETKAIGVFTKLTLKNQVDDLLDQFRSYYQGRLKATLVELRRSYDLLVLKVLALLQDADPPLAVAIASSRESIWGILSNRAKFAAV